MSATLTQDQPAKPTNTGLLALGPIRAAQPKLLASLVAALATGIITYENWAGSVLALVAAIPMLMLLSEVTRERLNRPVIVTAAFLGLAWLGLLIEPGPLNLLLFWLGLSGLALLLNSDQPAELSTGLSTILLNTIAAPLRVIANSDTLFGGPWFGRPATGMIANLLLPLVAVLVFGSLFAFANPLIGDALSWFSWDKPLNYLLSASTPVTMLVFAFLWIAFHMLPRKEKPESLQTAVPSWHSKYFSLTPVIATLVALNGMFAIENGLDYAYMWQGVTLPPGMTMIEYVHRGSYTLIVTVLLAAALIIAMLRPGTETEQSSWVRMLVLLFAAQNVLLVGSSAMRTLVYVDKEGMTLWRISALIWMGLVAFGLFTIAAKMILRKSNAWLLNTNLAAALAVLVVSGIADYRSMVADINVDRALAKLPEASLLRGEPADLEFDVAYAASLGPAARPALNRLTSALSGKPAIRMFVPHNLGNRQIVYQGALLPNAPLILKQQVDRLHAAEDAMQADWRTWTVRYANTLP